MASGGEEASLSDFYRVEEGRIFDKLKARIGELHHINQ